MAFVRRVLLVALELVCYVALALLVGTAGALIALNLTGACSEVGLDRIDCTSQSFHDIAEFSLAWIITAVFTGIPALLALGGIAFGLRRLYTRRTAANPAGAGSFGLFLLKGFSIIAGLVFAAGIVAGMAGGS